MKKLDSLGTFVWTIVNIILGLTMIVTLLVVTGDLIVQVISFIRNFLARRKAAPNSNPTPPSDAAGNPTAS